MRTTRVRVMATAAAVLTVALLAVAPNPAGASTAEPIPPGLDPTPSSTCPTPQFDNTVPFSEQDNLLVTHQDTGITQNYQVNTPGNSTFDGLTPQTGWQSAPTGPWLAPNSPDDVASTSARLGASGDSLVDAYDQWTRGNSPLEDYPSLVTTHAGASPQTTGVPAGTGSTTGAVGFEKGVVAAPFAAPSPTSTTTPLDQVAFVQAMGYRESPGLGTTPGPIDVDLYNNDGQGGLNPAMAAYAVFAAPPSGSWDSVSAAAARLPGSLDGQADLVLASSDAGQADLHVLQYDPGTAANLVNGDSSNVETVTNQTIPADGTGVTVESVQIAAGDFDGSGSDQIAVLLGTNLSGPDRYQLSIWQFDDTTGALTRPDSVLTRYLGLPMSATGGTDRTIDDPVLTTTDLGEGSTLALAYLDETADRVEVDAWNWALDAGTNSGSDHTVVPQARWVDPNVGDVPSAVTSMSITSGNADYDEPDELALAVTGTTSGAATSRLIVLDPSTTAGDTTYSSVADDEDGVGPQASVAFVNWQATALNWGLVSSTSCTTSTNTRISAAATTTPHWPGQPNGSNELQNEQYVGQTDTSGITVNTGATVSLSGSVKIGPSDLNSTITGTFSQEWIGSTRVAQTNDNFEQVGTSFTARTNNSLSESSITQACFTYELMKGTQPYEPNGAAPTYGTECQPDQTSSDPPPTSAEVEGWDREASSKCVGVGCPTTPADWDPFDPPWQSLTFGHPGVQATESGAAGTVEPDPAAIDGLITSPSTATAPGADPWVQVDLGAEAPVTTVRVYNPDGGCASCATPVTAGADSLNNALVSVIDTNNPDAIPSDPDELQACANALSSGATTAGHGACSWLSGSGANIETYPYSGAAGQELSVATLDVNGQAVTGRYVRIQSRGNAPAAGLNLAEVQVFDDFTAPTPDQYPTSVTPATTVAGQPAPDYFWAQVYDPAWDPASPWRQIQVLGTLRDYTGGVNGLVGSNGVNNEQELTASQATLEPNQGVDVDAQTLGDSEMGTVRIDRTGTQYIAATTSGYKATFGGSVGVSVGFDVPLIGGAVVTGTVGSSTSTGVTNDSTTTAIEDQLLEDETTQAGFPTYMDTSTGKPCSNYGGTCVLATWPEECSYSYTPFEYDTSDFSNSGVENDYYVSSQTVPNMVGTPGELTARLI